MTKKLFPPARVYVIAALLTIVGIPSFVFGAVDPIVSSVAVEKDQLRNILREHKIRRIAIWESIDAQLAEVNKILKNGAPIAPAAKPPIIKGGNGTTGESSKGGAAPLEWGDLARYFPTTLAQNGIRHKRPLSGISPRLGPDLTYESAPNIENRDQKDDGVAYNGSQNPIEAIVNAGGAPADTVLYINAWLSAGDPSIASNVRRVVVNQRYVVGAANNRAVLHGGVNGVGAPIIADLRRVALRVTLGPSIPASNRGTGVYDFGETEDYFLKDSPSVSGQAGGIVGGNAGVGANAGAGNNNQGGGQQPQGGNGGAPAGGAGAGAGAAAGGAFGGSPKP